MVFFDEIDAIAAERGRGFGDSNLGEWVVFGLLITSYRRCLAALRPWVIRLG